MAIVLYTDFADDEDTTHSQYIHNECICATSYFSTDSIWRFFVRVGLGTVLCREVSLLNVCPYKGPHYLIMQRFTGTFGAVGPRNMLPKIIRNYSHLCPVSNLTGESIGIYKSSPGDMTAVVL